MYFPHDCTENKKSLLIFTEEALNPSVYFPGIILGSGIPEPRCWWSWQQKNWGCQGEDHALRFGTWKAAFWAECPQFRGTSNQHLWLKNFSSFVLSSYASFRWVWESWISARLSQKFSGISASPALPCASVNRMNISHWRRTSNDFRKQPNREIHSVGLLVEGIYSILWTIHLVPEFKWGAGVRVERAGKHSSLVKMKEWV